MLKKPNPYLWVYIILFVVILVTMCFTKGCCNNIEYQSYVDNNSKVTTVSTQDFKKAPIDEYDIGQIESTEISKTTKVSTQKNCEPTNRSKNTTTTVKTTTEPYFYAQSKSKSKSENVITEITNVPSGSTSFHGYMDYQTLTVTSSDQYQLQQNCWTDSQGIRRYGDYVCVALGSYYGTEIGTVYRITTDEGNSYYAVLADCKADCHTDSLNQHRDTGTGYKNVVEFVVDTYAMDNSVRSSGNVGTYENYAGNITSIEIIK